MFPDHLQNLRKIMSVYSLSANASSFRTLDVGTCSFASGILYTLVTDVRSMGPI